LVAGGNIFLVINVTICFFCNMEEKKSITLPLRVTPSLAARIDIVRKSHGVSTPEYIRQAVASKLLADEAAAPSVSPAIAQVIQEASRLQIDIEAVLSDAVQRKLAA
jgi:hypothetical protein